MEQLPFLLQLPANASGQANYLIEIAPTLEHVVAIHALGWRLAATTMPAQLKVVFDGDLGQRKTGYYALGVASGSATPAGVINNGLLITPNTTLTYDSQEYQVPRLLCGGTFESVRRLGVTVSDFAGGPAVYSGTLYLELMITLNPNKHRYLTPAESPPAVLAALDGYFVNSGKRPRA